MTEIRQIKGKNVSQFEEDLDKLFAGTDSQQTIAVELPSRSKFYKNQEEILVSPLTFQDESRILNSKNKQIDAIDLIIENCVRGVEVRNLLQMDKLYLLMKIREISYGATYKFSLICPSCKADITTEFDVANDLNVNYIPENLEDPRKVMLPKLGVEAVVRFPRNFESVYLSDGDLFAKNLYKFVVAIDGKGDPVFVSQALKRMHIIDVKCISNEVLKGEFGVDPRFMFECPECGHQTKTELPLDASFFSVT
jgi:hypothetical protein